MKKVRFSIIIPVYNVEKYLSKCMDSVLAQTYSDYEVILIDDGSKDRSGEIADSYSLKDARVSVIHKTNEGLLKARLDGFEVANGEYILSLDSDDYWRPSLLESVDASIEETNADVVVFNFCKANDTQELDMEPCFPEKRFFANNKTEYYIMWAKNANLNAIWAKAFKKDIFCWTFDGETKRVMSGEDLLLSISVMRQAQSIVYLPIPLYCYRQNQAGISNNFKESKIQDFIVSRSEFQRFLIDCHDERAIENFEISTLSILAGTVSAILLSNIPDKKQGVSQLRNSQLYHSFGTKTFKKTNSIHLRVLLILFERNYFTLMYLFENITNRFRIK